MSDKPVTTVNLEKAGFLMPLLALWSLGGLIGIPSLLISVGFLVERGHLGTLGLPPSQLSAGPDDWAYRGSMWFVLTLRLLLFSSWWWFTFLLVPLGILSVWCWNRWFAWLWNQYAATWLPGLSPTLLALLGVGLPVSWVQVNLIIYHSSALFAQQSPTAPVGDEVIKELLEYRYTVDLREGTYYFLSVPCLGISVGLVGVFLGKRTLDAPTRHLVVLASSTADDSSKSPYASVRPLLVSLLQFAAVAISLFVLLNWPMCFGRLMVPYERPLIVWREEADKSLFGIPVGQEKENTGVVLNPNASTWVICSFRQGKAGQWDPQLRTVEPKALKYFRLTEQVYLFEYLRSEQQKPR